MLFFPRLSITSNDPQNKASRFDVGIVLWVMHVHIEVPILLSTPPSGLLIDL